MSKIRMDYNVSIGTIFHAVAIIGTILGIWASLEKRITTLEVKYETFYIKLESTSKKLDVMTERQTRVLGLLESLKGNKMNFKDE